MAPATESGIRVNALFYGFLFLLACIYTLNTVSTFNHNVVMGNDCSTQQQERHLLDLETFRTSAIRTSKQNDKDTSTFRELNELLVSKKEHITELQKEIANLKQENQAQNEANDNLLSTPQRAQDEPMGYLQKIQSARNGLPKLSELTRQSGSPDCGEGTIYKADTIVAEGNQEASTNKWNKIPKLIHQTSRYRCLTETFHNCTTKWSSWSDHGWSYYFHDDEAMQRMFEMNYHVFPFLKDVVENCLVSGTAKADLWRYLVLWHYGGMYSDLDTTPHNLSPDTFDSIATEENVLEGFFVIESFHFLSQYFFAIAPRHPLIYHTIMSALHNVLNVPDTSAFDASLITGPKALHLGLLHFVAAAGVKPPDGYNGFGKAFKHKVIRTNATIVGTDNATIVSYGVREDADFWVWRYGKGISSRQKRSGYEAMGMEDFGAFKNRRSGISCLEAIRKRHHGPDLLRYIRERKLEQHKIEILMKDDSAEG